MKIAIGLCEKVNEICTISSCLEVLNNIEKSFSIYGDEDLELMAFFTCKVCSSNSYQNLINIAKKLEEINVKRVHLGVCIIKYEKERIEKIRKIFENCNIEVIGETD